VILGGLIFSGSATGIVGVLISSAIIAAAWMWRQHSGGNLRLVAVRGALALLMVAAIGTAAASAFPGYVERVAANLSFQNVFLRATSSSIATRAEFLRKGLDLLLENPLLGYGMDQTGTGGLSRDASEYLTELYIHNTVIQMWFGGGIFALLGALVLYGRGLRLAWEGMRAYVLGAAAPWVLGLAASTVSWILMDQVQANIYQRFKWLIVALLIGQLHKLEVPARAQLKSRLRRVAGRVSLPDAPVDPAPLGNSAARQSIPES
jgi:O-antigen ligase